MVQGATLRSTCVECKCTCCLRFEKKKQCWPAVILALAERHRRRRHLKALPACLQVPLLFEGCSKLAVPEDYICSLVEQANSKMHSNWARVQRFFELLKQDAQQLSAAVPSAERQAKQQKGDPHLRPPSSKHTLLHHALQLLVMSLQRCTGTLSW